MARSRAEWATFIQALILAVDTNFDVDFGDINGVFVQPESIILSGLDSEITRLSSIIDIMNNYTSMTDDEFQAALGNYMLVLLQGTLATGQVYFQTSNLSADVTIPAGFPVATDQNSYGRNVVFYTTKQVKMLVANASLYFNATTNLYEIACDAQCTIAGSAGRVPGGAITVLMRALPGITSVTNKTAFTSGGMDVESKARAIRRLKGFLKSSGSLALKYGLVNSLLLYLQDVIVAGARDKGFQRTSHESGAVDAYAVEVTDQQVTDYFRVGYHNLEDCASNEVWIFQNQPVDELAPLSVVINGADHFDWFEIQKDVDSAYAGSVRAKDILKVLPTHVIDLNNQIGQYAVVTYNYNSMIGRLQQIFTADDKSVFGRDFLMREAIRVDAYINATITALPGYDPTTLAGVVYSAIYAYVNSLSIADPLEIADVTFVVMSFAGMDNITYQDFRLVTETPGTVHDVFPASRQCLRVLNYNLIVVT